VAQITYIDVKFAKLLIDIKIFDIEVVFFLRHIIRKFQCSTPNEGGIFDRFQVEKTEFILTLLCILISGLPLTDCD